MGDRLATIDMGWKVGCVPLFGGGGAGSPSNTMWPGPRSTSVPNYILIHTAVWPQQTWAKNWGLCRFLGAGAKSPSNAMSPGQRPTSIPSGILIHPPVWPQYTNVTSRQDNGPIEKRCYFSLWRYDRYDCLLGGDLKNEVTIHVHLTAHILETGLLTASLGGVTLCYKFDEYRVNGCVRNQTAFKCAQNDADSCVLKVWAVKCSGLAFWASLYLQVCSLGCITSFGFAGLFTF